MKSVKLYFISTIAMAIFFIQCKRDAPSINKPQDCLMFESIQDSNVRHLMCSIAHQDLQPLFAGYHLSINSSSNDPALIWTLNATSLHSGRTLSFSIRHHKARQKHAMPPLATILFEEVGQDTLSATGESMVRAFISKKLSLEMIVDVQSGWGQISLEGFVDQQEEKLGMQSLSQSRAVRVKNSILSQIETWKPSCVTVLPFREYIGVEDHQYKRAVNIYFVGKENLSSN